MAEGYRVTLEKDGNTLVLPPEEVSTPELPFRHSKVERWSLEVPWQDALRDHRLANVRVDYVDDDAGIDTLVYFGRLDLGDAPIKQPSIRLEGRGPGHRLQDEGSLTIVFTDFIAGYKVVEDFWAETPWTATVTEPTTEIVQTDEVAQSATTASGLEDVFSEWLLEPTHPEYISSEGLARHQTCQIIEGEDATGGTDFTDVDFSGGKAAGVNGIDDLRWDFTTQYDIPAESGRIYWRGVNETTDGSVSQSSVDLILDGREVLNDTILTTNTLEWNSQAFDFELSAGQHTLEIDVEQQFENDNQIFDLLAVIDERYYHTADGANNTFDNTVNIDNGYLDEPRLVGVTAADSDIPVSNTAQGSFNIIESTANIAAISDNGNALQLQMRVEDSMWLPDNGTEIDTASVTVDWDAIGELGIGLQGRVNMIGYSPQGAQNETPRFGYESEIITEWELLRTTNDLSIIPAGTRYTGSYYEVAQEVHDDAGMVFTTPIETDTNDNIKRVVESFEKGDVTKTADWDRTGGSRGWNTREYANVIEVYGPVPEDDPDTQADESLNDRPKTTVKLDSEITRVGQEIHADDPIVDDELDTESKRNSAGRNKLLSLAASDDEDATLQIVPQIITPGYSYNVPLLGEEATLERLQFADGVGTDAPTATLSFAAPTELPDLAARLRGRND